MKREYRAPMCRAVWLEGRPLFQLQNYEADEGEEQFSNIRDGEMAGSFGRLTSGMSCGGE